MVTGDTTSISYPQKDDLAVFTVVLHVLVERRVVRTNRLRRVVIKRAVISLSLLA